MFTKLNVRLILCCLLSRLMVFNQIFKMQKKPAYEKDENLWALLLFVEGHARPTGHVLNIK